MDGSGLTRRTRWCQTFSPTFSPGLSSLEVMKNITQKTIFLFLVTSLTYSIRLTANLRAQIDSGDPGLSFGFFIHLFYFFHFSLSFGYLIPDLGVESL